MPEGHTIHRLARDLRQLSGEPLHATSPQGRFDAAESIDGSLLEATEAFGKHLFLHVEGGLAVHVHLGMRGKWLRYPDPATPPLRQARLRLATSRVAWDLVAPTSCELLDGQGVRKVTSRLGPDPLRPDGDAEAAVTAMAADRRPVGAVLLDQAVLAGVGNVFRNEALHELGVDPRTAASALGHGRLTTLWQALQRMMVQAVEDGRIVTVDVPDRLSVPEAEARRVYKQGHCRDCGAPVTVAAVGGRTAYWCPVEQPPPATG